MLRRRELLKAPAAVAVVTAAGVTWRGAEQHVLAPCMRSGLHIHSDGLKRRPSKSASFRGADCTPIARDVLPPDIAAAFHQQADWSASAA